MGSRWRTAIAVLAVVALVGGLVAGVLVALQDDEPPATPEQTVPLWNPCDGLDPVMVEQALDADLVLDTGGAHSPVCRFTPLTEGDPVLDANYAVSVGSLDELVGTFGEAGEGTRVTRPDVPRSDDARLIGTVEDDTLLLSGFVQNRELVQLVNVLAPAPFDRSALERGVREVLVAMAAHAAEADAGRPAQPGD